MRLAGDLRSTRDHTHWHEFCLSLNPAVIRSRKDEVGPDRKKNDDDESVSDDKPSVRAARSDAGGRDHLLHRERQCRWPDGHLLCSWFI